MSIGVIGIEVLFSAVLLLFGVSSDDLIEELILPIATQAPMPAAITSSKPTAIISFFEECVDCAVSGVTLAGGGVSGGLTTAVGRGDGGAGGCSDCGDTIPG